MNNDLNEEDIIAIAEELEAELFKLYGPLLSGDVLRKALGFPTIEAMRKAIVRGHLPIPVFDIEHRVGKHALAKDVAYWLAKIRTKALQKQTVKTKKEDST